MAGSTYDILRGEIVSGARAPGSRLVETTLADQYGVSRTPIREALLKLQQDGLLERDGRGLVVRKQSPEEILEIYEMRILLESFAARSAASRRTELDLMRLARAHDEMVRLTGSETNACAAANREFHRRLWTATHNGTLIDLLERINDQLHRYPQTTLSFPGRWEQVLADHEVLLEVIRKNNAEEAAEIASRHMVDARNIRLQMYREFDDSAAMSTRVGVIL